MLGLIGDLLLGGDKPLTLLCVFERRRGMPGHFGQRLLVVVRNVAADFVNRLKGAEQRTSLPAQWNAD